MSAGVMSLAGCPAEQQAAAPPPPSPSAASTRPPTQEPAAGTFVLDVAPFPGGASKEGERKLDELGEGSGTPLSAQAEGAPGAIPDDPRLRECVLTAFKALQFPSAWSKNAPGSDSARIAVELKLRRAAE